MSTGIEKNETDSHEGKTERTTPSKERRVFQSSTTKEKKNERKGMQLPTKAPSVEALWENLREKEREKIKRTKTASSPTVRWNQSFGESSLPVGASESRSLQNEEFLTILDKTKAAIHADLPKTMPKASDSKSEATEDDVGRVQKRSRLSGVDALLEKLQKKKKANVLDQSKRYWRDFKDANTADAEELEAHQRSTERYLEKQQFLTQAAENEHRAEIERKHSRRTS